MDTDEAIDTVVGLAKAFLVMNDNLQEGIKVQPNRLPKVEEAIELLIKNGLPNGINDNIAIIKAVLFFITKNTYNKYINNIGK